MKRLIQNSILAVILCCAAQYGFAAATFTVTETHTDANCYNGSDGTINISVTGTTGPYTFVWADGPLTQNRSGLAAGTYTVTVTDTTPASKIISIIISQPSYFSVTRTVTGENCGGQNIGTINLSVSGATGGYTYLWNDGDTSQNRLGLTAAVYYVTITDSKSCTTVDSANVTQPPGVAISAIVTDASCGINNGEIDITVDYGNPGYTYLWSDSATSQNRIGVGAGSYILTVTDAIGCSVSTSIPVNQAGIYMSINTTDVQPSCFGGSDGTINVISVIGSTGPFSYVWGDGPLSQNRTNLSSNIYWVTATSSTGCTASTFVNLAQPAAINIVLTPFPLTCFESHNGAINSNTTGGTSPYTYAWTGAPATKNVFGLVSGNYTVTVTDAKGCTATATTFVPEPTQVAVIATPVPVSCIGGPTGGVTTTVLGGTPTYTYWWGGPNFTPDRVNVNAGTYTVQVTDSHGCTATASATVPAYTPISLTATHTNVTCFSNNTGSIDLTVSGGQSSYSYVWSSTDTTQDIALLIAGTYTVTVTDNRGCTATKAVNITQPAFGMNINSTTVDANCFGGNDGSINLSVTNGSSPYIFQWNNLSNQQNRTNLIAGNYTLTVTDASSCSITSSFIINQPNILAITPIDTNVDCFGSNTGAIGLTVTGGFAPFSYNWNGSSSTKNINHLAAGNYTVIVTDNHSCTANATTSISQPTAVTSNITSGNLTCFGSNDGWVNVVAGGGTAAYTYDWGGSNSANRTGLSPGTYTVTITDNNGCIKIDSAAITEPAQIAISGTTSNASCNNGSNGSIILSVSGGSPTYTYDWGGGIITPNRTSLSVGNYIVTVTDNAGCSSSNTFTISQPPSLSTTVTSTNITCNGANNGSINITVNGGVTPYAFDWGSSIHNQNRTALGAGIYWVTVTDSAGCSITDSATIIEPSVFGLSAVITNVTCFGGSDGGINLSPSGGTFPYSYDWNGTNTSKTRTNLTAGNYPVTVTDNAGCTAVLSPTVTQPPALNVSVTQANIPCYGGSSGSIQTVTTGGIAPYTFDWGSSINTAGRTGLTAGSYTLTVMDSTACPVTMTIVITQPDSIALNATQTDVNCYGQPTGRISLAPVGGTGNYTYNWINSITTQNLNGMMAGSYWVKVTDANHCSDSASFIITQPSQISTSITSIQNPTCFAGTNGSIGISNTGGAGGYTYVWSNNSRNQNLSGVGAGNYTVTITDASSCTSQSSINLTQPNPIAVQANINNVSCPGGSNGSITVTATGGNGGYSYTWNTGPQVTSISGLAYGNYTVTVKDIANCTAYFTESVAQPAVIAPNETHNNASCGINNGSITLAVTGGTQPYNYVWSNNNTGGAQNSGLAPNNYLVTITDANSCSTSASIAITQSSGLTINTTHTDFACTTQPGTINVAVSGGASPYNYNWGGGVFTPSRNNLAAGTYQVTVTDANTCTSSASVTVAQMAQLASAINKIDVTCYGGNNGSIHLSVNGGTLPYKYAWTGGASTQNLGNLSASSYNVVITDSNNCTASAVATISQPSQIQINHTITAVGCYGGNDGGINVSITGGAPAYGYKWSNNSTLQNIDSLSAGNYILTVTDTSNCSVTSGPITVNQAAKIQINGIITPVGCTGLNDGTIQLTITGGTPAYSFVWSNQFTGQNIANASAGTYIVAVSDNHHCMAVDTFKINSTTPVKVSATVTNSSCLTSQNGSIDLNVTGGTPPYSFNWNDGHHSNNLMNISQGQYSVSVTDVMNCSTQSVYNITTEYELIIHASPSVAIKQGEVTQLSVTTNVDHGNTYAWTPSAFVTCANCPATEAFAPQNTLYTISVVDANGCKAVDTVGVQVSPIGGIFIPNAFSPNQDGNNDEFQLFGDISDLRYLEVMVFNRWGEKVFESNDHNFKWDGTYKGEPSPIGAYIYIMQTVLSDGTRKEFKGSVTLLR